MAHRLEATVSVTIWIKAKKKRKKDQHVCQRLLTSGGMCPLCICPVVICCWAEGIVPILKVSGPPIDPDRIIPGRATEPCSTRPTRLNCCCKIVDLIKKEKEIESSKKNFIINHTKTLTLCIVIDCIFLTFFSLIDHSMYFILEATFIHSPTLGALRFGSKHRPYD